MHKVIDVIKNDLMKDAKPNTTTPIRYSCLIDDIHGTKQVIMLAGFGEIKDCEWGDENVFSTTVIVQPSLNLQKAYHESETVLDDLGYEYSYEDAFYAYQEAYQGLSTAVYDVLQEVK